MRLGPALSSAFASIDIFVMPSESETLGFVVLEALASRVPAVAVRAGGIAGIIEHNVTGLLSAATGGADATEFANNVIYLIKNSDRRHHMGLLGRQYAEKLSWRTATEKLRRIQYPASINLKRTVGRGWLRDSRNLTAEKLVLESMRCEEFEFDLDH